MVVLRLGYACAPRRRQDVMAALRVIDGIGAPSGWPSGRYLLVDTRGAGEPDLEVEYTFASLTDMERRETRLREQLRANARDGGPDTTSWQAGLIAPGTRRLLTQVESPDAGRTSLEARRDMPAVHTSTPAVAAMISPSDVTDEVDDETEPDEEPIEIDASSLTPEGQIPAPLAPQEQKARARSLVREVPGLRVGFGPSADPSPRRDG
jgi:hypothetical protein